MKSYLADRTSLIDASGIRKVFALAATLKDPINFSIGLPDFDVPGEIKDAAVEAIREGMNRYSQTAGDDELLARITAKVKAETGWDDPKSIVTSGVSGALLLTFMAVINPGDEVIVPDPYFVIYKHLVRMLGGRCVFVDSYPDFSLPVQGIADAITDKTKLIILNSPTNPTGAVYSEDDIREVARVAREKNILVMSDEIYDQFSYDSPAPSVARHYENTLLIKGFSKSYAMTGWRLGYAAGVGPVKAVIEEMTKIQQYTFVCAPTPFQKAAIAAMDTDISPYIEAYHRKRDMIYNGLKGKFDIPVAPQGAFYIFVKAPDRYPSATEFVKKAIENNVLIIPGGVFSEKDTHFRISYATTEDKIQQGAEILCRLADGK